MCNFPSCVISNTEKSHQFYSAQLAFKSVTWCRGCCTSSQFLPGKGLFLGSSDQFNPIEIETTNHSLLRMAFGTVDELTSSNVHVQTDEMAGIRMSIINSITLMSSACCINKDSRHASLRKMYNCNDDSNIYIIAYYYILNEIANCWALATEHSRATIKIHHYQQEGWQQYHHHLYSDISNRNNEKTNTMLVEDVQHDTKQQNNHHQLLYLLLL